MVKYSEVVEIDVGLEKKLQFRTSSALQKFIDNERAFWTSYFDFKSDLNDGYKINFYNDLQKVYLDKLNEIESKIESENELIRDLSRKQNSDTYLIIFSKSLEASYVLEIKEVNKFKSLLALYGFTINEHSDIYRNQIVSIQNAGINELWHRAFARLSLVERSVYYAKDLDLSKSSNKQVKKLVAEINSEIELIRDSNEKLLENISTSTKKSQDYEAELKKRFDEQFNDFEKRIKDSEDFYLNKLQLDSAVSYWDTKASKEKTYSKKMRGWFIGHLVVFLFSLIGIAVYLLTNFNPAEKVNPPIWMHVFIFTYIAIYSWILRIVNKQRLSHQHAMGEAKMRSTMVLTYLALSDNARDRDQADYFDKYSSTLLEAIFRPIADGLVKDDLLMSPIEVISKMSSPR